MRQPLSNTFTGQMRNSICLILLLFCGACTSGGQQSNSLSVTMPQLPGQQIWKQGASSFLFGTNDTYEWAPQNIQTVPAIQDALRNAGFTLIRSFFPDNASDAVIEQRIKTITNSGAHCLGVITNIANTSFDQHLVRYLGNRCLMYEFGNEPDYNNISIEAYLNAWNKTIPLLRHINPQATFIGPVTSYDLGNHGFMQAFLQGVKSSHILPDAISFHWYACWNDTKEACLAKAGSAAQAVQRVRQQVQNILGKDLPIGISEWNYDPGNPPPAYGDDANFIKQFSTQALKSMIQAHVAFACQFDAASYGGYGRLDMFTINDGRAKPQYYAIKALIQQYRPPNTPSTTVATGSQPPPAGELISQGATVYCAENNVGPGGPQAIVSGRYGDWSFWRSDLSSLPSWCAIHLTTHASRLLLMWSSDYSFDYIGDTGMSPQDYTLSVSPDSTDGSDGSWKTVVTVTNSHTRVREHLLPFTGQSWVKMTVTKGQPKAAQSALTIDAIDLYDASSSFNDSIIFSGDSITVMAYNRFDENQPSYAKNVHAAFPQHLPLMLDAGMGGLISDSAVQNIDTWLALNPDIHYWALGWGTNDALWHVSPAHFQANIQLLVDKIKQQGRVPILPHIPYINHPGETSVDQEVQALNSIIDQITKSNHLIQGPDLYTLTKTHASTYLGSDGIHPTPAGAIAMNKAWFEALKSAIYG